MGLVDWDNPRLCMVVLNYFRDIELHMGQNCKTNQGKYRQIGRICQTLIDSFIKFNISYGSK